MLKYVILILIIVVLNSALIFATEVYEQQDAQGNIVYSDTPLNPQAQKLNVPSQPVAKTSATPSSTSKEVTQTTPSTDTITPPSQSILPGSPTTPTTSVPPEMIGAPLETADQQPHTTFAIESPKDQDTIYNQPVTPVKIMIVPKLKKGEKVAVLLDGKPTGVPVAGTDLQISILDRGTHQLSAVLLDEKNQIIKQTPSITIYVHRTSVNNILTSPAG